MNSYCLLLTGFYLGLLSESRNTVNYPPVGTSNSGKLGSFGESSGQGGSWPKDGNDLSNTFRSVEGKVRGRVRWVYHPPVSNSEPGARPVVDTMGNLYFGVEGGDFFAVNSSGKLLWRSKTPFGQCFASSAIGKKGDIYVAGHNGLVALSSSGHVKWTVKTKGDCSEAAISPDGTIYFGAADGVLRAVSLQGKLLWARKFSGPKMSCPAIGEKGTLYFGSDDYYVYAVNRHGEVLWKYRTRWKIRAPVSVSSSGLVYAPSGDGSLYVLTKTGKLVWAYDTSGTSIMSNVALNTDGSVLVPCFTSGLLKLSSKGRLLWKLQGSSFSGEPVIEKDGTVLGGSLAVNSISPSGHIEWSLPIPDYYGSCPVIGRGGRTYVINSDGDVYAID